MEQLMLKHTNHELVERIKEKIRAEPTKFDMDLWIEEHNCGTVACIGGYAILLSNAVYSSGQYSPIAARLLANGNEEEMKLWSSFFHVLEWNVAARKRLDQYELGTPEYAEVSCDFLDSFIADPWSVLKRNNE
jgi:hypothetical protein